MAIFNMIGQNYAKSSFTTYANPERRDTNMEDSDKRSLSESASPTRDGILRTGSKHARVYKNLFTTSVRVSSDIQIEVVSQLSAAQSFPFNLFDNAFQGSNSQATLASSLSSVEASKVVDSMSRI